ncbi:hypothetical protein R5R35_012901 [Gryllus longicercus]|uniref:MADF domain-containing protein n=1 Tax=Gryllus longicercus TaxID=2509291 RepID=A0AAN9VZN0_9ORTH
MNIDERFILAVREYPFLYDAADPGYHDIRQKDKAWQQISESFQGWSAEECRKRWIALRDSFRKSYKKRRRGQVAKQRPWKYESAMSFIISHLTDRNYSNLTIESGESTDSSCNIAPLFDIIDGAGNQREEHVKIERIETIEECNEIPNAASGITSYTAGTSDPPRSSLHPPVAQSLQEDLHDRKRSSEVYEDALCAFFKAMEKTVRTFSVPMQIEIKGKISNLINEYELKNYRQQVPE